MFRLNMPFEPGIDYGCRHFRGLPWSGKRFLILEEEQYRVQQALSDISGSDVRRHEGRFDLAMREVRNWLRNCTGADAPGPSAIVSRYYDWQRWHFDTMLARGYSEDDIRRYPTFELLESIEERLAEGRPPSP